MSTDEGMIQERRQRGVNASAEAVYSILAELVYAGNFYIALYDPRTQLLSFPYHVDERDPLPAPAKLGKGLTEYVLRTGQPYLDSPEREQELLARGEIELVGTPSVGQRSRAVTSASWTSSSARSKLPRARTSAAVSRPACSRKTAASSST